MLIIVSCGGSSHKEQKPSDAKTDSKYDQNDSDDERSAASKGFSEDESRGSKSFSEEGLTFASKRSSRRRIGPPRPSYRRTDHRQGSNYEKYENYGENQRVSPLVEPVSTFSIDVDTASYSIARRYLKRRRRLPPKSSVRVEEFVNYFTYNYPIPIGNLPFSITMEMAPSPFDKDRHLLHIGLQGKKVSKSQRPSSNLVFLIDVSGSMMSRDRLPLVKQSLKLLIKNMTSKDRISMVVYAGAAGVVLPPTPGNDTERIEEALDSLQAGGSTHGSQGIELAYKMAEKSYIQGGINRVILATDGDFNVGISNHRDLVKLIEQKRKSGIALTVLGFGMYNLNDRSMKQFSSKGNGNYFYIDNLNEGRKVLVDELSATLQIIAKDVKMQIEFNPKYVHSYRLLGYENRRLARKDFDDDKKDAGEIGAGKTVTAIYEITLTSSAKAQSGLRYGKESSEIRKRVKKTNTQFNDEIAFFKLRYKQPDGDQSSLYKKPLKKSEILNRNPSRDFLFSAGVAHFAQKLRESQYTKGISYDKIIQIMQQSRGEDPYGYRKECISLVQDTQNYSKRQYQ